MADWSRTWTYLDGDWHEGNVPVLGPRSHAMWLGSSVFDGARAFEGVTPDLDRHCARVNASATALGLAADGERRDDRGTDARGPEALRCEGRDLHPADVLGGAGRLHVGSGRSRLDAVPAVPLRDADAAAGRVFGDRLAVSPADAGNDAHQRQGGLPLPQQRTGDHGGESARIRQRAGSRSSSATSPRRGRRTSSWRRTGW